MKEQRCTRCIMDNVSDTTITFDGRGYCNYCNDVSKRMPMEYFPNEEGKQKLNDIMAQIKRDCKNDEYDCLVGVSGGIDSSYILCLGYQYGLRMLALHIDDGLDNPTATENLKKLAEKTETKIVSIYPNHAEYADILKSLLKASVSNLAFAQDNLIIKAVQDYGERNHIRYALDGNNFAHESILERGNGVNNCDKRFILSLQKRFGEKSIQKLEFISLTDRYVKRRFFSTVQHIRPLNYIPYHLAESIDELERFCGFQYYGGKHYESVLTRFLQCYYLPEKFGMDKRKSHFSSLILSGQMTREEALEKLSQPLYPSEALLQQDKQTLAAFIGVSLEEFEGYLHLPPKQDREYPHSILNEMAHLARKFRKIIE